MSAAAPLGGLPDVHVGDVDAGVAQDRADPADHAGAVVVAHDEHVVGRRHVDGVVVDRDDAGLAPQADERAGEGVAAAPDADQVDVVVRRWWWCLATSMPCSSASSGAFT